MPSPPIQVFLTTIASQPALRQRQEYLLRILQTKKIEFTPYDLASDEQAKKLWKRKAPPDKQQLPGILVGGRFPGIFTDFEDAVEHNELESFLRLNESYDAAVDEDRPAPVVQPIGVPGAALPLQMTPERLRTKILSSSPSRKAPGVPVNKREGAFDVSTELSGFGLQGVMVTPNELADLVAELGLDGEDAGDLVRGLSDKASTTKSGKSGSTGTRVAEASEASDSRTVLPGVEAENAKGKATAVEDAPAADSTSSEPTATSDGEAAT